ncbi:hypothetical protein [Gordonia iterans]
MSDLVPDPSTPPAEYERMGREARYNGQPFRPPVLIRDDDPRTLAYIAGYETADHDILRKGQ